MPRHVVIYTCVHKGMHGTRRQSVELGIASLSLSLTYTHKYTNTNTQVSGAGYFIKREPAKQAMAHLRYLAQQHSYPVVAAVLNAMYPPACPPVVRLVPISVPRKHLLIALPLRSDQDRYVCVYVCAWDCDIRVSAYMGA